MNKGQAVFRTYTTLARVPGRASRAGGPRPWPTGWVTCCSRCAHEQREMVVGNLRRVLGADADDRRRAPRPLGTPVVSGLRSLLGRGLPAGPHLAGRSGAADVREGIEHLAEGMATGKGVVMALPHVGSWEYGGAFLATQDLPMTAVAERLEPPELFDFFVEQRAAMGLTIVPLDGHRAAPHGHASRRRTGRPAVRPRPRRQRHRGRVLRRDAPPCRPARPPWPSGPARRWSPVRSTAARAATTGPSSSRPSTPPGRARSGRTWPASPRRSPPGSRA